MNPNLVSITKLKKILKSKGLDKYITEIGYSKVKDKKYYVITKDNKRINFGYLKMSDYLTNHDDEKRYRFKQRFKKMFEKSKDDYNKAIFWSYLLLL